MQESRVSFTISWHIAVVFRLAEWPTQSIGPMMLRIVICLLRHKLKQHHTIGNHVFVYIYTNMFIYVYAYIYIVVQVSFYVQSGWPKSWQLTSCVDHRKFWPGACSFAHQRLFTTNDSYDRTKQIPNMCACIQAIPRHNCVL